MLDRDASRGAELAAAVSWRVGRTPERRRRLRRLAAALAARQSGGGARPAGGGAAWTCTTP